MTTWVCATCGPVPAGTIRHLDHDSPHGHETHECGSSAGLDWTKTKEHEMDAIPDADTAAIRELWLKPCPPCDFGLPHGCVCPNGSHREVIAQLCDALDAAREATANAKQERDEMGDALLSVGEQVGRALGYEPQNRVTVNITSELDRLIRQRDLLLEKS